MDKNDNIMDSLKNCPFKLPDNYTDRIEENVRRKIKKEETSNMTLLRPNFALLLTFIAILGIGYGIMTWVTPADYVKAGNGAEVTATVDTIIDTVPGSRLSSEEEAIEDYLIETGFTITALASIE